MLDEGRTTMRNHGSKSINSNVKFFGGGAEAEGFGGGNFQPVFVACVL